MGRGPRITITGIIHHVINRGNNRQVVFRDGADYKKYIELLERYKEKYGFRLYSYVLMSNHIHLLIEAGEKGSISKIMQGLTLAHTKYFNLKYKTSGHVWQVRYREFVKEGLKEEKLKEMRETVVGGRGYGSDEYLRKVEETIKARLIRGRRGRPKKKRCVSLCY